MFYKHSYVANNQLCKPSGWLPDGNEFKIWQNETTCSKTYYVDTNNAIVSDSNAGATAAPFKTINKAAQVVQDGERVFAPMSQDRLFVFKLMPTRFPLTVILAYIIERMFLSALAA